MDLDGFIEEQRALFEVPGCAVGAIAGDEVALNKGFGTRLLGADVPVSTRTLFPIGSTTKAFTAAAVGALVDDGLIEWDRPLREYIPGFAMHDPVATERISILDLLSHRSGLPRHEFAWLGNPERSRGDLVRRLRHLPLSKDIRQSFQYSNLGFVTAGYLVEVVTGSTWEEYVATRLLKPIGMERTNFSVEDVLRADDFSKPHERRGGSVVEIPFREFDQVGPAGSINSCADEMLAWLRVHLTGGKAGETAVITPDSIARMHMPQMVIPEDRTFPEVTQFAYGLGWLIGQYRGHRVVSHKGGIDGFLTECMLLPDQGIGVVVLTNCWSELGPAVAFRIFDELLGLEQIDWSARLKEHADAAREGQKQAKDERPRVEGAALLRPLEEYAGDYEHPGYGTISVAVEGDGLKPTFGNLQLSMTHRHFDVFDLEWRELVEQDIRFVLTFLTGPDGDVVALTVPFEDTVDPIRFDRQPDPRASDPRVLDGLTGRYEMGPVELVVARKGEHALTVATPGSPAADLLPGRGLRFSVKDAGLTVEFVLDDAGRVEKLVVQPLGVFLPKA